MATRTYAQGAYHYTIKLAEYSRKHSAKLATAALPASVTQALIAAQNAEADAKAAQNTYNP